jgi:hypothetical protein
MKSLTLLPVSSVCAIVYLSTAVAAEPSNRTDVASVDPTTLGATETSDASVDTAESSPPAAASEEREAKNAIYVDLLGPGLFYSINYDRMLTADISARIGLSYLAFGASATSGGETTSAEFSYYAIPLTVSYLGFGSESNMLELGGGPVLMNIKGEGIIEADGEATAGGGSATLLAMTGMAGYRHQPADGGFVFRVGASPMMVFGAGVLPWGYLSLGAAF